MFVGVEDRSGCLHRRRDGSRRLDLLYVLVKLACIWGCTYNFVWANFGKVQFHVTHIYIIKIISISELYEIEIYLVHFIDYYILSTNLRLFIKINCKLKVICKCYNLLIWLLKVEFIIVNICKNSQLLN